MKHRFGITLNDYKRMLLEQKGVCAICGNPETTAHRKTGDKIRALAIDHDHETGNVRELLCYKCNTGIAQFRENIVYLANAIAYLQKHSSPLQAVGEQLGL